MTSEPFTLRWGILATGGIAKTFTKDLLIPPPTRSVTSINHVLAAAGSSTSLSRATAFLAEVNAPPTAIPHGSYTSLVSSPTVDIIYIATPHSLHYAHALLALSAGKHILVEKPLTVNAAQAERIFALARRKRLFVLEAVWTRFFPLTREVQDVVREGRLGTVKRVYADLSYWKDVEGEFGVGHRMVNLELAGGALLDLGVYALMWVGCLLWHLQRGEKREPGVQSAMSLYAGTGCDEMSSVLLEFKGVGVGRVDGTDGSGDGGEELHRDNGDAHALAQTSLRTGTSPTQNSPSSTPAVRIQGTRAEIHIPFPPYRPLSYTLIPAPTPHAPASFPLETKHFPVPANGHGMFWEADECARCIRDGLLESEVLPWEESLLGMRILDRVREQGGLVYPEAVESVGGEGV